MPARHRSPTLILGTPAGAMVAMILFVGLVIALVFARGLVEASGIAAAFLPLIIAVVAMSVVHRGKDPNFHPVFKQADDKKYREALVKLVLVEAFGLFLLLVLSNTNVPLAESGVGLVTATLVGVASWTLLGEILSVFALGERLVDETTDPKP